MGFVMYVKGIIADIERLINQVEHSLDENDDGDVTAMEALDALAAKAKAVYDKMTPEQRQLVGQILERALLAIVAGGSPVQAVEGAIVEVVMDPAPVVEADPAPTPVADPAPTDAA